ncbi:MAG: hypothetical protein CMJ35_01510 [Phycisphaerae bacterium]|nr:hypothetical protein [Phycisphaerae bacterium]MBM90275.1 hypothetical protein [Phycisphaerae bacterium]HCT45108.1 hypothetical protein [Phycisphaerales bacterium]
MSIRTLLIWIIIAGMLGGAAVFVRQKHIAALGEQEVVWVGLEFDPAGVISLSVEGEGGSVEIQRDADSIDQWRGAWSNGVSWGLASNRVRAGLRSLATARVRLSDEAVMNSPDRTTTVRSRDGSIITLSIGSDRLGGRVPVRVEQRDESGAIERVVDGWLDTALVDSFTSDVVLGWRDDRLFDMAASSVSQLRLSADKHAVSLLRTPNGWVIDDPIEVHANREKVDELVRSLLSVQAQRFIDEEIDEATSGLSKPLARIMVGDEASGSSLTIGTRADINADTLYARFEQGGHSTLITVSTDALTKLTAYPDAYVSKTAGGFGLTSVRSVRVLGRDDVMKLDAVRNGATWLIADQEADTLTNESIDRLLSILLLQPAFGVRLVDASFELPKIIAGVELLDANGAPLGEYDIALEQAADGLRLLVIGDLGDGRRVVWGYRGDDAQATGTWLTIAASRPTPKN